MHDTVVPQSSLADQYLRDVLVLWAGWKQKSFLHERAGLFSGDTLSCLRVQPWPAEIITLIWEIILFLASSITLIMTRLRDKR